MMILYKYTMKNTLLNEIAEQTCQQRQSNLSGKWPNKSFQPTAHASVESKH